MFRVCELASVRVAYMRRLGAYGPEISQTWEKLMQWEREKSIPLGIGVGAYWDDPQMTPVEQCRADVCLCVPENVAPDPQAGVDIQILPAGRYAIALHDFTDAEADYPKFWRELCEEVAKTPGLTPADKATAPKPCYEIYYHSPFCNSPSKRWIVDFCLALSD